MIANSHFPAPGTEVGCEYRWPFDHAHPDCWMPPHKGVVLPLDDPRAWENTLAFPNQLPSQEAVTNHVNKCLQEATLLRSTVPVLWTSSIDGKQFIQWDSKLIPYEESLKKWEEARKKAYRTLPKTA